MKQRLWMIAVITAGMWCGVGGPARAACTNPAGDEGAIIYNTDHGVFQGCTATGWMLLAGTNTYIAGGDPPTDCPTVGDACSDGSVFAGLNGSDPIYTTHCDAGMFWDGNNCTGGRGQYPWNNGNSADYVTTSAADASDGAANTATLIATDSDSGTAGTQPHQAAQYCADLIAHGQDDWYLPAKNELNILYGNHAAIGNFETSGTWYWSSSEFDIYYAWRQRFSDGYQSYTSGHAKYNTNAVRCIRR